MVKAIHDFLWYKAGEEIKEEDSKNIIAWKKEGLIEEAKKAEVVKPSSKKKIIKGD